MQVTRSIELKRGEINGKEETHKEKEVNKATGERGSHFFNLRIKTLLLLFFLLCLGVPNRGIQAFNQGDLTLFVNHNYGQVNDTVFANLSLGGGVDVGQSWQSPQLIDLTGILHNSGALLLYLSEEITAPFVVPITREVGRLVAYVTSIASEDDDDFIPFLLLVISFLSVCSVFAYSFFNIR